MEQSTRLSGPQARVAASDILAAIDLSTGSSAEQIARLEQAISSIDRLGGRCDDEIDRLSVLRMKESLRLLAGPDSTGGGGVLPGLATWDGTLLLDEVHVTGPLKQMYDQPAMPKSPETLRRYRFALSEMFHQQSHLLAAAGTSYRASMAAFADPAVRLLELGVTAAWTARHLDDYLQALGIPQLAPGIEQVSLPDGYPSYLPAAEALSTAIGRRVGLAPDEVLRRLNAVTPAGKWPEMTTLLLNASGLGPVVPPDHRAAVAGRVDQAMRAPLRSMATLRVTDGDEPGVQATSRAAGLASVDAAVATIEAVRREYTTH
ncbi:hypothetical protein GCM10009554_24260 [Kribbella koreensis]|uniref:Uncharacterized protein n=1 Tax=Kribbella koreensis TaxID=57909 RepID=A0ABN1Q2V3_9ACTN